MSDDFDFDLNLKEKTFRLRGVDKTVRVFVMRELNGAGRDVFLRELSPKLKTGPDGQPQGVKDFSGLHASLLGACLFDDKGTQISPAELQTWPAEVQIKLFDEAMKLSGLDKTAEVAAKNGSPPSDVPGTS